jgi:arylsulfatase A-like enzyme
LGQMKRLLRASGEGALAGCVAGMVYGGWEIFLQRDLHYGFHRLAAERSASGALEGALLASMLSLLVWIGLEVLRGLGRRALIAGALLLGILGLAFLVLAGGPSRETFFPHHRFSGALLSLTVFTVLALILGGLVAWRIRDALAPVEDRSGLGRGSPAIAGGLVTLASLLVVLVAPHLPLARGATGRSIILVSVDTLRADRLGTYGCTRPLTPRFDALARDGTVFEQATAAAPWTLPSHAALFTSLLPFTSGARNEHRYLGPGVATLAERLRNAGYRTAAFTGGGYIHSGLGFDQGFEIYQDHDEVPEGGPGAIVAAALSWIRSVRDRPFFAFIHTYATHFPYRHEEFTDPKSPVHGRIFETADLEEVRLRSRVLSDVERRQIRNLYDGGVAYADRAIGGMLESLEREGVLDKSLLVILSDHGEDLWDHDEVLSPGHGHSLYQEMLLVPLLVRAPGLVRPRSRIHTPVSLLDVLPTLREIAGLSVSAPEQGRSLVKSLLTGEEPAPGAIFSESIEYGPDRFARRERDTKVIVAPTPDVNLSSVAVTVRPLEIFDLSADPKETRSLALSATPLAAESAQDLWKRVRAVYDPARESGESSRIPRELREQLRALGYIQ